LVTRRVVEARQTICHGAAAAIVHGQGAAIRGAFFVHRADILAPCTLMAIEQR